MLKKLLIGLGIAIIFLILFHTYRWLEPTFNVPVVDSYIACGCGCCGGLEGEATDICLYRSKGENLRDIIIEDKRASSSYICRYAGCSFPKKYVYCD
jgi:hypothetical protein